MKIESQYEEMKNLSKDERIKYEKELILSGNTDKLHEYMDGLISNIMETLRNKENITIPIDEKFRERLHEKVDKASKLYIKNIEKDKTNLFSVYYTYFVNEVLDKVKK
jgi:hypothetical protein